MRKIIIILLPLFLVSCSHTKKPQPPEPWLLGFNHSLELSSEDQKYKELYLSEYWYPFLDGDKLNLKEFIYFMYTEGGHSQQDGDGMADLAIRLYCIEQDPYNELLNYLNSNDPKKMIYAGWTAMLLGDYRFYKELVKHTKDKRKVNSFSGQTLGECMDSFSSLLKPTHHPFNLGGDYLKQFRAQWLIKVHEQGTEEAR